MATERKPRGLGYDNRSSTSTTDADHFVSTGKISAVRGPEPRQPVNFQLIGENEIEMHHRLKRMAVERRVKLRELLVEAIEEYLAKREDV